MEKIMIQIEDLKKQIQLKKTAIRKIRNVRNPNAIKANQLQHEKRKKIKAEIKLLEEQLQPLEKKYQFLKTNNIQIDDPDSININ